MKEKKHLLEFVPLRSFSPHIRKVLTTCWYEVSSFMREDLSTSLSISLVSVTKMRELNRKHRKQDKPTDVLSLDFGEDKTGHKLGMIFLCRPVIAKQAKKLGHSLEKEIVFLTTHGMLHVWGFDHEEKKAEENMLNMQKRLLQAFPEYSPLFSTYRSRELID